MCLFILFYSIFSFNIFWLLTKWYPPALCTCSCSPCFNELAVLMNLGHISHYFCPLCQGCDWRYYALPFDDFLWCIMYLHCWLFGFDFCTTLTINILSLSLSLSLTHGSDVCYAFAPRGRRVTQSFFFRTKRNHGTIPVRKKTGTRWFRWSFSGEVKSQWRQLCDEEIAPSLGNLSLETQAAILSTNG